MLENQIITPPHQKLIPLSLSFVCAIIPSSIHHNPLRRSRLIPR